MAYDLYPAVDADYNFPPEVRASLAKSLDLRNTVIPMTTVQRNNLAGADLWDGRLILNTTTDRINRYDAGTAAWIAIADFGDAVKTVANAAARTAFAGQIVGQLIYQIDTDQVYRWNGAAWLRVGSSKAPYGRATGTWAAGVFVLNGGVIAEMLPGPAAVEEVMGGVTFAAQRLTVPENGIYACHGYIATAARSAPNNGVFLWIGFNTAGTAKPVGDPGNYLGDGNLVGTQHQTVSQHKRLLAGQFVSLIGQGIGGQTDIAQSSLSIEKVRD